MNPLMADHRLSLIETSVVDTFLPVIAEGGHTDGYLDIR